MALLVYVDESGKPYQIDEGPYVLASVAIDELELDNVVNVISSFINDVRRNLGISIDEIHTKHLVKGNEAWSRIPMPERAKVFQQFADIISSLNITLNIVAALKGRPGVKISSPPSIRRHVIKLLIERLYLTRSKYKVAIMIFDSIAFGMDANIRLDVEEGIKSSLSPQTYRLYVAFKDSREEQAIQIADYVAYLMRHILMKQYRWAYFNFEEAFLKIEPKIRRCPGSSCYNGCGLKIWYIT